MELSTRSDDEREGRRPAWTAPRLQKLKGRRDVAAGPGGEFDGTAGSTNFS